jgi:hypothetical protein
MIRRFAAIALAFFAAIAFAQEGHPLSGTWHGEWTSASGQKSRIVMALRWDTKNVVGTLNPGPRSAKFTDVTLDPEKARELFVDACTACHTLDRVRVQHLNGDEWRHLIAGMLSEGVPLTDEETSLLVNYLAQYFGPEKQ